MQIEVTHELSNQIRACEVICGCDGENFIGGVVMDRWCSETLREMHHSCQIATR